MGPNEATLAALSSKGPAIEAPKPTDEDDVDEELGCWGNGVATAPYCIGAQCCGACCSNSPFPTPGWCCAQEEYDALESFKAKMQKTPTISESVLKACDLAGCVEAVTKCARTCVTDGLLSADCKTCMGDDWNMCSKCIPVDASQKDIENDLWALADPAGTYKGSKDIFGEDIEATVTQVDSTHMSMTVSGAVSVNCGYEPYTYSNGVINVSNAQTPGDCIYEALNHDGLSLKSVSYNPSRDMITVTVQKGFFLSLDIELTKSAQVGEEELGCWGNGVATAPYCVGAQCCAACCSNSPFPTPGWCCAQEEYDELEKVKSALNIQVPKAPMN